ncbi:MAG: lysine--tRNA ligase, partial [Thermodesulfovibrionia bacterium]|nr:lysine--tRNA ligase [Thermodesulfovibrionia bacterium]
MEEINELMQERIKKLKQLRELGIDPYGGVFEVKDRVSDILEKYENISKEELETKNENYTIAGRIIAFWSCGTAAFA